MVRIVTQNFSPPRSRHSSGETTDWDLAERADSALSTLARKRIEGAEYESSSDSFWDSEFDGELHDINYSESRRSRDDLNGNEMVMNSDVQSKRKERRRERNKLSAQAYRLRRRQTSVKEQQELTVLEERNRHLLKLVDDLEKETEDVKKSLRTCSVPMNEIVSHGCDLNSTASTTHDRNSTSSNSPSPLCSAINMNTLEFKTDVFVPLVSPKIEHHSSSFKGSSQNNPVPNLNTEPKSTNATVVTNANNPMRGAKVFSGADALCSLSMPNYLAVQSVKPKQGFCNSNMNYKVPIIRPSTLQTVPELPSSPTADIGESSMSSETSQISGTSESCCAILSDKRNDNYCERKTSIIAMCNSNNMNHFQPASDVEAVMNRKQNCDKTEFNSLQFVSYGGNYNQNIENFASQLPDKNPNMNQSKPDNFFCPLVSQ